MPENHLIRKYLDGLKGTGEMVGRRADKWLTRTIFEVRKVIEPLPKHVQELETAIRSPHISGKMRMNFIRILPGDRVMVDYL